MPLNQSRRIESLEHSMLESDEDSGQDWVIEPSSQAEQLRDALSQRRLGPAGLALYHWLQTGGDPSPEVLTLLQKVCKKVHLQVWSSKDGFQNGPETLSADTILEGLPGLIFEERKHEALNRWAFGCKPGPEDSHLLAAILDSTEMKELARRYGSEPPYNRPADRLPFEPVPGESVEEEILD